MSDARELTLIKAMIVVGIGIHVILIWAWPYPPILDWPNHMARHYLEARALAGKALPSGYQVNYLLVPNLGSDLMVPLLLQVLPLTVASRLFLTFNVVVCWLGFSLFVGRQAASSGNQYGASLLVLPFLLIGPFFLGFLNYSSGIGLAFLAFLNYLHMSERETRPYQYVFHGFVVALLYVWHLAAFGTYAVLHASHLLMHAVKHRRLVTEHPENLRKVFTRPVLIALAALLPVVTLIAIRKLTATPEALDGSITWHGVAAKLSTAVETLIYTYRLRVDVIAVALWAVAVITMVRVESWRRCQLDWLHVATFIFLVLYLILPLGIGTTWNVDMRALPPLLICCIALIARLPARRVVPGAALALAATAVHVGVIDAYWAGLSKVRDQHLAFIRQLPVGARILSVIGAYGSSYDEVNFIAWAVPERQAMVSSLFAIGGQQPLTVSVNKLGPFTHLTPDGLKIDIERVQAGKFDYVYYFDSTGKPMSVPADWSHVYSASSVTVWKIR